MYVPNNRKLITPYRVICHYHKACLSEREYSEQMAQPDKTWRCPVCGEHAEWDDAWHEMFLDDPLQMVYASIGAEREAQDAEWGGPDHDDTHAAEDWLQFIDHQVSKADELIGVSEDGRDAEFRARLVKVAALAVAGIQSLDRYNRTGGNATAKLQGYYRRGGQLRRHHAAREDDVTQEQRFPVGDDKGLHVFRDAAPGGEWVIWLNTQASDFDGLVIGLGATRDEAIAQAVKVAEDIETALQGPPPEVNRG